MKFPSPKDRYVLIAFLAILLVFGTLVIRKYLISTTPPEPPAPVEDTQRQLREVMLYFGAVDGRHLTVEVREIEDCLEEIDCIEETVQALIDGPVGDLVPVVPPHAVLRGVIAEEGTATVDLSREVVTGHPGGSMSELLTVYALANTLSANFPHIRQVRVLVEGEPRETLKGHVDLHDPVQADFDFSRSSSGRTDGGGSSDAGEEEK